jgi:hypothetical protein
MCALFYFGAARMQGPILMLLLLLPEMCKGAITPPIFMIVADTIIARPTTTDFSYVNIAQLHYIQTWIDFATYMKFLGPYGYFSNVAMCFTFSGGEMVAHLEATVKNADGGLTISEIQALLGPDVAVVLSVSPGALAVSPDMSQTFVVVADQMIHSYTDFQTNANTAQVQYIQSWIKHATYMIILGANGYILDLNMRFSPPTVSGGIIMSHVEATVKNANGGLLLSEIQALLYRDILVNIHVGDSIGLIRSDSYTPLPVTTTTPKPIVAVQKVENNYDKMMFNVALPSSCAKTNANAFVYLLLLAVLYGLL